MRCMFELFEKREEFLTPTATYMPPLIPVYQGKLLSVSPHVVIRSIYCKTRSRERETSYVHPVF